MDADGQHSTAHIGEMIATSLAHPGCMVLGSPVFDETAPRIRVVGHGVANFVTRLVTSGGGIGDSLFGFSGLSDCSIDRDIRDGRPACAGSTSTLKR